jgi:hypothetical protein
VNCKRCDTTMTPQEVKNANLRSGYPAGYCVSCQKEWKREQNFKSRYNITIEEYEQMLIFQDRKCAVCNDTLLPKKTVVDHCHDSGDVRGLLCYHCNNAIGFIKEDVSAALRLVDYIYTNKMRKLPGNDSLSQQRIDERDEGDDDP